jgi:RNA ligase (TIGR02306 family)
MAERKLASIQEIFNISSIPGADRICKAQVMGWNVVIPIMYDYVPRTGKEKRQGLYREGHRVIFCEVDSVLPEGPYWSEFLRPHKFRVKTARLRGVLSQGLVLPAEILPRPGIGSPGMRQGDDVSKLLGITKHEPPVPKSQFIAGTFPGVIPKTNEIRLQSAPELLEELRGVPFYTTVKLDGTSMTAVKQNYQLQVAGRNWSIQDGNNPYWDMIRKYDLATRLPEGMAVQGEICGPGIQKNRLGLKDLDFFVFNVFDVRKGRYLDMEEMFKFCTDLQLEIVPVEAFFDSFDSSISDLESFLFLAQGTYEGTKNRREGIVVRPKHERRSETLGGSRLSFKVLNNEFLEKDED